MTISDKAVGLESIAGDKGARLYDANELMEAIYRPRQDHEYIAWEETDAVDLADAM